jgi:hypothetical protein
MKQAIYLLTEGIHNLVLYSWRYACYKPSDRPAPAVTVIVHIKYYSSHMEVTVMFV